MKKFIYMSSVGIPFLENHKVAFVHEDNIYQVPVGQYLLVDTSGKAYLPIRDNEDTSRFYINAPLPEDLKWDYLNIKDAGHSLAEYDLKGCPKELSVKEILQGFGLLDTEKLEAALLSKLEHLMENK